jgi:isopenicillin N synthase-like dioxygenase
MRQPQTFTLPASVTGTHANVDLARDMIAAWRNDGIFQITTGMNQACRLDRAFEASRRFFRMPLSSKARCTNDLTYSGYLAGGGEGLAGESDFSEIFTVCPDLAPDHPQVRAQWPCHGPVPWPDEEYQHTISTTLEDLAVIGDKLLRLLALGLHLYDVEALSRIADGGWHHLHALRLPPASGRSSRGIGSHTDYGLLVIGAQDEVGGLRVRPPVDGEPRKRNWLAGESSAGMYEEHEPWVEVPPAPRALTVMPGDLLQFMTEGFLVATPQKVALSPHERLSLTYFHEPRFDTILRPLFDPEAREAIHYGTHFTNLYMRCYPERSTTRRIVGENRLAHLPERRSARRAA